MAKKVSRAADAGPPPEDRHKNTVVSFRPPAEMRARLQELAEQERRSVAQVIEFLIEEAFAARDKRSQRRGNEQ